MDNPKIVQKKTKGRQLQKTVDARLKKLEQLEKQAIKKILKENPPRAFSARGQVELTRSHRSRRGAMESSRRSSVAKELKAKRTRRALSALGNPGMQEHGVMAMQLMSHDDANPGMFEKSYMKWQSSMKPKDLLDAFEYATLAELHYRHAGKETESGFADAQAEGVRREILELEL